jgi:hypothetical protein
MKKKLKKIYIFLFLLLLTSYNPQENPINKDSIFLPIKYIIIENNKESFLFIWEKFSFIKEEKRKKNLGKF